MTRFRRFSDDTFRSLRIRNFRLFFAGQLISQVGNWMTMIVQTLFVLRLTGSGVALGLLAAAQFGPVLLFGPWAGLVADRSDKRRLLLVVQSLAMLQSFVLATLVFSGHAPLPAIYALAVFGGFTTAFDNPARRAFVVEMVPTEAMNNAVSLNSALMTGARVIGPALGGLLVTTVGFGWAFLADGISYLAVLAGLARMDTTELRRSGPPARGRGQVREGLRYVRSVPELFVPMAMMAVIGLLAFNFSTVLPLFVQRELNGTEVTFTWLMSIISAGSLVGALASARRRITDLHVVALSCLAFGTAMAALCLAPNLATAYVAGVLVGVSSISFMTAQTAIVQTRSAPSMRGRVLALQSMLFLGTTPIGGPVVGLITERYGARYSLALGAGATLVAGTAGLLAARRADPRPLWGRAARDAVVEAIAEIELGESGQDRRPPAAVTGSQRRAS